MRRTAHVLLHPSHRAGWFEIKAPRVEGNSLSNEDDQR